VFPYVEVWYANPSDLVLLAANGPIRWSSERVAAHFDPATPAGRALRDWVRVAQPTQLLGRFLLGENGTSALAQQAAFTHTDNRPALEFVAARSLLATSASSEVFDSLVGLKNMTGDSLPLLDGGWRLAPGEWEAAYARSLPATNRFALALAQRAVEADPRDPERHVLLGRVLFDRDRYRAALASFREALRLDPSHGDALVLGGQAAATVAEFEESRTLLERGLAAGGDTVLALSALAETAVGQGDYERAADLARRAVRAVRPTLRAPFPAALQSAVRRLAWEAPPPLAARVLSAARESRPSWDLGYHGGAVALVRWGPEYCGEAQSVAAELPRFGWTAREIIRLLGGCARL
jgi:tetratricopeptide (TPR) repeat protein